MVERGRIVWEGDVYGDFLTGEVRIVRPTHYNSDAVHLTAAGYAQVAQDAMRKREVVRFAWLPVRVDGRWHWLTRYTTTEWRLLP